MVAQRVLAGVDEVGRGPLAGDVVAAAVILDSDQPIIGLNDSKKLSEKKRQLLSEIIKEKAVAWSIARADVIEIDSINILHASLLAMKRAVESLCVQPDHVLVDGNRLPNWEISSEAIVKGDGLIDEIKAASILAKVCRDNEMIELASVYPNYGFDKHKGYPTKQHLEALSKWGPTEIHRKSFGPVKSLLSNN